jgi:hypothetical protein
MDPRRFIAIGAIVVGAICVFFSNYIAVQVAEGKYKVASGQQKVNMIDSAFSQSKYTKGVGQVFTGSAQRRIDEGKAEIAKYEGLANKLQVGGAIVAVLGVVLLFVWKRRT